MQITYHNTAVLWHTISDFHILYSSLGDVDGH